MRSLDWSNRPTVRDPLAVVDFCDTNNEGVARLRAEAQHVEAARALARSAIVTCTDTRRPDQHGRGVA